MSGLGHLAAGFAAKPSAPKIPLWVLLAAAETNDILYGIFTAVGLEESAQTTMSFTTGIKYLTPVSNPWSHGLFMSVVWSLLIGAAAFLVFRDRRSGIILALVVFSHWVLDLLMHSNLPLFLEGSPLVGLGLENSGPGFILITVFDLLILAASLVYYFMQRKQISKLS